MPLNKIEKNMLIEKRTDKGMGYHKAKEEVKKESEFIKITAKFIKARQKEIETLKKKREFVNKKFKEEIERLRNAKEKEPPKTNFGYATTRHLSRIMLILKRPMRIREIAESGCMGKNQAKDGMKFLEKIGFTKKTYDNSMKADFYELIKSDFEEHEKT